MSAFRASIALLIVLAAGCRAPTSAPETSPEPAAHTPVGEGERDGMTMEGIELFMHPAKALEGVPGKPELWVRADRFSIAENRHYRFENAEAILYGRDGRDDITISADRGSFEQDKSAFLEGQVRMKAGTLHMHLRDIMWTTTDAPDGGVARTDNPVIVVDPELQLNAAGLRLCPDTSTFELDNVSGVIRFDLDLF